MGGEEQRVDKWLFFARICKSRSLAQKLAVSGAVRVNREKIASASRPVRAGDVLTIATGREVRVLRVLDLGIRRGPYPEARALYDDLGRAAAPGPDTQASEPPAA